MQLAMMWSMFLPGFMLTFGRYLVDRRRRR